MKIIRQEFITKTTSYITIGILLIIFSTTHLFAQSSDQSEIDKIDQEILKLEKKKAELKQRKLQELIKQRQELNQKIKELEQSRDSSGANGSVNEESEQKNVEDKDQTDTKVGTKPVNFEKKDSTDSNNSPEPAPQVPPKGSDTAVVKVPQTTTQTQTNTDTIDKVAENLAIDIIERLIDDKQKGNSSTPRIDLTDDSANIQQLLFKKYFEPEKKDIIKDVMGDEEKSKNSVLDVEAVRADKLLGSTAKSNGTTTLVSKGGIPLIFSLATEYGGAVSSTNGTSTTFQFNPVGLSDLLTRRPDLPSENELTCKNEVGLRKALCRTSFGLTFDISRGVDMPEFTGSKEQLSQISFRYEFLKNREPNVYRFKRATESFLNKNLQISAVQFNALSVLIDTPNDKFNNNVLQTWYNDWNNSLAGVTLRLTNINSTDSEFDISEEDRKFNIKGLKKNILDNNNKVPVDELRKDVKATAAIKSFGDVANAYLKAKQEYVKEIYKKTQFTFEYTNNRELMSPDSSNFLIIAEKGFGNGMDFTFNGSFALFHSKPEVGGMITTDDVANFKRLRDFSFAAQLDIPLFGVPSISDSSFSLAAKYQRMSSGTFFFNNMAFEGLKGDILIGQAKLNLAIGKSGLFLPLSFTYANRSELNKEKESRGNFGFTFDISPIIERYMSGLLNQ